MQLITRHCGGEIKTRHRHAAGYIAIVLTGSYIEAGDGGRWCAQQGTVVIHGAYEAHLNVFGSACSVLNLPAVDGLSPGVGVADDVDAIARLAEQNPAAAARHVANGWRTGAAPLADWPDALAQAILAEPSLSLAGWADANRLSPTSVSRGFGRTYGISPKRFRMEARTRGAIDSVLKSLTSFTEIATAHGFADQAHMTRAISAMTGCSPGALRQSTFKRPEPYFANVPA